jgi:hypothetical protein
MDIEDSTKTDSDKTTENPRSNPRFDLSYFSQIHTQPDSFNEMFPEQERENKTIKRASEILGDKYTVEEVTSMIASFEYLINAWMEEYEKKIFDNKSLKELLREL